MITPALIERTKVAWNNMNERCHNPNHVSYSNYGGRGVQVCQRWRKCYNEDGTHPENRTEDIKAADKLARALFMGDVGIKPINSKFIQLSRDNDIGDYEPGNVQWAVMKSVGIIRPAHITNREIIAQELDSPKLSEQVEDLRRLVGTSKVFRAGVFADYFGLTLDSTLVGRFLCKFNVDTGIELAFRQMGASHYIVTDWNKFSTALHNVSEDHMGEMPAYIGTGVNNRSVYIKKP